MNKLLGAAALALVCGANAAAASEIKLTYQDDGLFGSDNLAKTVSIDSGNSWQRVKAGMFHMSAVSDPLGDFLAFCVDIAQRINNPQYVTINNELFESAKRDRIGQLFDSVLDGKSMADGFTTPVGAAGFQVALWEVVYETESTYSLDSGTFRAADKPSVVAEATKILNNIDSGAVDAYDMTFLESEDHQDLVTVAPVPLPASALLLGFGVAGFAGVNRRKKRV